MARRYLCDIDLLSFSLLNAKLHPVSADPTGLGVGDSGRAWFNTTTGKFMVWNGTTAIDLLARANHTGTQTASTISDLATAVQGYRLDQFAAPNVALSAGSQRITNLADPVGAQDAATLAYLTAQLSSLASGQVLKGAVTCAPTVNVALTAPGATLDGVTMTSGMIVLLTGQTTASANGPYVWTGPAATLTRATNWNTTAQAVLGSYWIVEQGANADTFGLLTNDATVTLGTTALTFTFRGAAGATYSVNGGLTLAGTAISVNPGTGILAPAGAGTTVAIDTTIVARRVMGLIPATTAGIVTVSGSTVTINHGLGNSAAALSLRYGSAGTVPGQQLEADNSASDANNIVITLPAAPAVNVYAYSIVG